MRLDNSCPRPLARRAGVADEAVFQSLCEEHLIFHAQCEKLDCSKALATRFPRAVRALQREHECFRWKFEWIAALGQTLPVAEVLPTPATCRRAVGKQCRETPWALRTHFL